MRNFKDLVAEMPEEDQRRIRDGIVKLSDASHFYFCGESPEQQQAFAEYCAAMSAGPVPLRTALEQIAEELECSSDLNALPPGPLPYLHRALRQHAAQKDGNTSK